MTRPGWDVFVHTAFPLTAWGPAVSRTARCLPGQADGAFQARDCPRPSPGHRIRQTRRRRTCAAGLRADCRVVADVVRQGCSPGVPETGTVRHSQAWCRVCFPPLMGRVRGLRRTGPARGAVPGPGMTGMRAGSVARAHFAGRTRPSAPAPGGRCLSPADGRDADQAFCRPPVSAALPATALSCSGRGAVLSVLCCAGCLELTPVPARAVEQEARIPVA